MAREVKVKLCLEEEPEVFPIAEGHLILQFKMENDFGLARKGGPWFVAGQLLAIKPWEPDFVSDRRPIKKAMVW